MKLREEAKDNFIDAVNKEVTLTKEERNKIMEAFERELILSCARVYYEDEVNMCEESAGITLSDEERKGIALDLIGDDHVGQTIIDAINEVIY